jgi:hypothetical protein
LLLAVALAAPATAEVVVHGRSDGPSGRTIERVRIGGDGITISSESEGDTLVWSSDSARFDADLTVGGREYHGTGIVRLFSDAEVRAGEQVDGDVVAVFGDVRVDGTLSGSAVAVMGSVHLGPGARVGQDAVAVGGQLEPAEGASVAGESISVGFLPLTLGLPAIPVVLSTILIGWLVSAFFGWLLGTLFPDRLARVARTCSRRTALSLALGILSGPLAIVTGVLLLVTVIGVPLAILLPLMYLGALYAGQLAGAYVLGCKLTGRRLGEGQPLLPMLVGHLLIAALFVTGALLWPQDGAVRTLALFFHLAGLLTLLGLTTIGVGAVLLSRLGAGEPAPAAPHATPPAPPVTPVTAPLA